MQRLSERVRRLRPSATLSLDAKARDLRRKGIPVISLAVGEPDMDTPGAVKEAAIRSLRAGETKYTEPAGIPELRAAIARKLRRDQGLTYSPEQISVTSGAKQAVFNALLALSGPGDEVLLPAPYWVSYPDMVGLAGAEPVPVRWTGGFAVDLEDLKRKAGKRTRLILLNSPNNPTGAVYSRKALEGIAAIARKRDLIVISDEIYEKLVFGGARHVSIASLDGMAERTVLVNGCSKAYAMTGWRLGYAAGPAGILAAMVKLQSQSSTCVAAFVQRAAVAALDGGDALVSPMVAEFDRRRRAVLARVRSWPGIRLEETEGAFYLFPDLSAFLGKRLDGKGEPLRDDLALSDLLLRKARVAVVPGTPFGAPGHLRLSTAASMKTLEKASDAVARVLARLR